MRKTNNYKSKNYKRNTKNNTYKKRPSKHSKTIVGKIYAGWCGHCQMLETPWNQMKADLGKKGGSFEFAEIEQKNEPMGVQKINDTYLKKSHTKLSLQGGYPTLFKIKNGVLHYFNGNRTLNDMTKWYSQ
jgi:thiol-disulfide isomerase/thioredoxin